MLTAQGLLGSQDFFRETNFKRTKSIQIPSFMVVSHPMGFIPRRISGRSHQNTWHSQDQPFGQGAQEELPSNNQTLQLKIPHKYRCMHIYKCIYIYMCYKYYMICMYIHRCLVADFSIK